LETVIGAVTSSPGIIPLNVTRALVGNVLMSTSPVVNVFPGTEAVSVKSASTLMLSSATNAANTMIVAKSFRAISLVLSIRVRLGRTRLWCAYQIFGRD
jgi:hypothetical protein